MIKVTIRSYDVIAATMPADMRLNQEMGDPIEVELEDGAKVLEVFEKLPWLGRPFEDTILVFINEQAEKLFSVLQSGDIINIMTPSGGA